MEWFKELTLTGKIEAYGELMYDMGTCPVSAKKEEKELFQAEKKEMFDIINEDIKKLQEVSEWIYNSVLEVNKKEGEKK